MSFVREYNTERIINGAHVVAVTVDTLHRVIAELTNGLNVIVHLGGSQEQGGQFRDNLVKTLFMGD